ncbi:MAG: hypothetical protein JSS09_02580, partial [Verrucomicrobia bacterium]|nr:hypothetical protein [Verrucomicrobiota bacterium]
QGIFADLAQWEEACSSNVEEKKEKEEKILVSPAKVKKLSYKEQKELEGMEAAILRAEEELLSLQKKLDENLDVKKSSILYEQMGEIQITLDSLYERWQVLLDKSSSIDGMK